MTIMHSIYLYLSFLGLLSVVLYSCCLVNDGKLCGSLPEADLDRISRTETIMALPHSCCFRPGKVASRCNLFYSSGWQSNRQHNVLSCIKKSDQDNAHLQTKVFHWCCLPKIVFFFNCLKSLYMWHLIGRRRNLLICD